MSYECFVYIAVSLANTVYYYHTAIVICLQLIMNTPLPNKKIAEICSEISCQMFSTFKDVYVYFILSSSDFDIHRVFFLFCTYNCIIN